MPLILPNKLPAVRALYDENIFVMEPDQAAHQDIRPLEILIVNLMPNKIITETQLARVLANSPLQVKLTLLRTGTRKSNHTPPEHMIAFYRTLDEVREKRFDGMIITGAPIEMLEYNQVDYWDELTEMLEFGSKNVYSTIYLCWAAMAALYCNFGIEKYKMPQKLHGVFAHSVTRPSNPLMRGIDETFYVPHSRQAYVRKEDVQEHPELRVLAESEEAGLHILATDNGREIYIFGHMEYDKETLLNEYNRDIEKKPPMPRNYFIGNDPAKGINFCWRSAGHLFYLNWLNYYVYQQTPYNLNELSRRSR